MSDIKHNQPDSLSRQAITEIIRHYGFIECAQLLSFLQFTCEALPGISELTYIRDKLKACLKNHDDQSEYFCELWVLYRALNDAVIYHISSKNLC
ncbi:hypothetical protein [Enterobacter cloacae]|uniref:hypothetical protein n=1 Tax=Enterobacter cloacae TaxID=550 RepID=UPI002FF7A3D4